MNQYECLLDYDDLDYDDYDEEYEDDICEEDEEYEDELTKIARQAGWRINDDGEFEYEDEFNR